MERLRDQEATSDRVAAAMARLVRAGRPATLSALQQRRVRVALERTPRRSRAWLLRPAIATLLLVGLVSAASATVGRHFWVARRIESNVAPPSATRAVHPVPATKPVLPLPVAPVPEKVLSAPPVATPHPSSPLRKAVSSPRVVPTIAPSEEVASAVGETVDEPRPEAAKPIEPIVASPTAAPTTTPTVAIVVLPKSAPSPETELLYAATTALRTDRDARKTAALLTTYRKQFPNGVLEEEALALALEASVALADGKTAELAKSYLVKFPGGRFAESAKSFIAH